MSGNDECPEWCDAPTAHTAPHKHVHWRLIGEVPVPREHAEVTRVHITIQQHPHTTEPIVALRTDGVLDFGRRTLRRLNNLLTEAERLLRN
ncbi:hypothetical protein GCM10010124_23260 [Pilimelia terevasa]|uniref:Uncharacterized protein n=1 Tax=Pilimelia terevasa TaxID=53372 RepID=A0A8J3FJN5_9ACTN|nr:hypothetical protein GCM10010124_23260 [Pilimelia terevasa]